MMAVRSNFEERKFILKCYWKYRNTQLKCKDRRWSTSPRASPKTFWGGTFPGLFLPLRGFLSMSAAVRNASTGRFQTGDSHLLLCLKLPANLSLQLHFHTSSCILEWISILQGLQWVWLPSLILMGLIWSLKKKQTIELSAAEEFGTPIVSGRIQCQSGYMLQHLAD